MKKDNEKLKKTNAAETSAAEKQNEEYSLNDDRRVKVLSPGAMVAKRFFRNRIAMVGLFVLIAMFLFSFVGGLLSPNGEAELFYRTDVMQKQYAAATENTDFNYIVADGQKFGSAEVAQVKRAMADGNDRFNYRGVDYMFAQISDDLIIVYLDDGADLTAELGHLAEKAAPAEQTEAPAADEAAADAQQTEEAADDAPDEPALFTASHVEVSLVYKSIFSPSNESYKPDYATLSAILKAEALEKREFTVGEDSFELSEDGLVTKNGEEFGFISTWAIKAAMPDIFLTRSFKENILHCIENKETSVTFADEDGVEHEYTLTYDASHDVWSINQGTETQVYDRYSSPSWDHWLGTDGKGMDMLTRLMYGGRVSLMIGFIVEIIATTIGVILGGISGYFGGWIDNLIMRIVDIFYCIPSMPIIIILGASMDHMGLDPKIRMIYLMLILGILGWPSIARMVRGQILSLREQEFMTATEATGISVNRRIFRHLIPNVIPQLIVSCTMGLGSTILTEATLSFLGLGVRFPFASWGNIINDVKETHVLTTYLFVWIPAGILLLLTVLAFNILGDGLRDAFDPKMKR